MASQDQLTGELLRRQGEGYVVRVQDAAGGEHRVLIGPEGDVHDHETDDFVPPDERSPQEDDLYRQVYNFAAAVVHQETDIDAVDRLWQPAYLEECMNVVAECSDATFERFRPYYEDLQNPSVDVSKEDVYLVLQPVTRAEDGSIDGVHDRYFNVQRPNGEYDWIDADDERRLSSGPIGIADKLDVPLHLPTYTFEWSFEDGFQDFLVRHLACQVRDAYVNRGQRPPDRYQIDGYGKITFAGEHLSDA